MATILSRAIDPPDQTTGPLHKALGRLLAPRTARSSSPESSDHGCEHKHEFSLALRAFLRAASPLPGNLSARLRGVCARQVPHSTLINHMPRVVDMTAG